MESLEARVSQAKERYQSTVYSAKDSRETLSALPQFPVNDKFVLNQDEAWYTLSIELQIPIDTVMLQVNGKCVCVGWGEGKGDCREKGEERGQSVACIICTLYHMSPPLLSSLSLFLQSNVPLDLQEVDKSSAVVSYTPPDPEVCSTSLNLLLFLYFLSFSLSYCLPTCVYTCTCTSPITCVVCLFV